MKKMVSLFFSILLMGAVAGCNAKPVERNQMGGVKKAPDAVEEPAEKEEGQVEDEGMDDAEVEDTDKNDTEGADTDSDMDDGDSSDTEDTNADNDSK